MVSNLFGESDESGEEFEGFHHDWVTDPCRFRPVNVPDCALDSGSAYEHPKETTAAYYVGLLWDDEVNNEMTYYNESGCPMFMLGLFLGSCF